MNLKKLGLDGKDPVATNLDDKNLIVKKIFSPPIAKNELLESLRFQFMEETQNTQQTVEIRYDKLIEENEEGMQGFLVYGLPSEQLESIQKKYLELGLKVVAAEPLATSLASLVEMIFPEVEKLRGIFYKEDTKTLFVGMKGNELLFIKSFGNANAEAEAEDVRGDWMIEFQQAVDEFLLQEKMSMLEEGVILGSWSEEEKNKILMTLGIPCKEMLNQDLPQFDFASPELKNKFSKFMPEISLAIFPKANT